MNGQTVAVVIVLIVIGGVTASMLAYFRLQRHRADAVAMAAYRKLAEDAVAQHESLQAQLAELSRAVKNIETLLRSVE